MAKVGRPSKYNIKLADTICNRIANGESLLSISKEEDMPVASTIHLWVLENDEFSDKYEKARLMQAAYMFDELLDIADDGKNDWMDKEDPDNPGYNLNGEHIQRSRLRTDVRKWYLSKVAPKVYGDKLDLSSLGKKIEGNTIIVRDFSDESTTDDK